MFATIRVGSRTRGRFVNPAFSNAGRDHAKRNVEKLPERKSLTSWGEDGKKGMCVRTVVPRISGSLSRWIEDGRTDTDRKQRAKAKLVISSTYWQDVGRLETNI